jgi:hypothetical protein
VVWGASIGAGFETGAGVDGHDVHDDHDANRTAVALSIKVLVFEIGARGEVTEALLCERIELPRMGPNRTEEENYPDQHENLLRDPIVHVPL